jgi:tetratricopeptide (TPR) repeat protein
MSKLFQTVQQELILTRSCLLSATLLALASGATLSAGALAAARAHSPYTYAHHVVSTDVPAAQFAFDRGLTLVFAYESNEAERSFREAASLDPTLAMAWWGIALALGPDINSEPTPRNNAIAAEAMTRAKLLAITRASTDEREYIAALSRRYGTDPKPDFDALAVAYRDAMRALVARHPSDPDAAALYAEAIMDLHPWRLWTSEGQPGPDTNELVALIERGLREHPQHIGLLHFYIHAVEASNDPGRALAAARRLASLPMEPAASHLVHMPAHIFFRVGDWPAAIAANEHAVHHALEFRLSRNPKQERACGHCVDFLTYAFMMDGEEARARRSAEDYRQMSGDPINALSVLIRFHEWDDLLAFAQPDTDEKPRDEHNLHALLGYWHFARGLAFVAKGRSDEARTELKSLANETTQLPAVPPFGEALNVEHSLDWVAQRGDADMLQMSADILEARIVEMSGDLARATTLLENAVAVEDLTPYGEPPSWFYPIRESLGAIQLKQNAAAAAEATFREGLRRVPNDPRLLLGLGASLKAEQRGSDAATEERAFQAAWRGSGSEPAASGM